MMVLVTGGTGMLGSHLLLELIKKGQSVRAIRRKTSNMENVRKIFSFYEKNYDEYFNKIEWFEADVLELESLIPALEGVEKVYHAAAMVSFDPRDKYRMIDNNVKGTVNLVNACLECRIHKLCHVSSISALGYTGNDDFITEETFRNPKGRYSGYSISKFRSEMEVWRGITEGLNAVIVNPSIILGPGDWKSGSPSIFSNIGKGLKFYTEGITGYVDVLDVVNSMIRLMESEISNERFIVSSENLSFKEIFSLVADSLGVKRPTVRANAFMLGIAWRFEALISRLTGKVPLVTKDSAHSAKSINRFSNEKLIKMLDINYMPIAESVGRIAGIYLNDTKSGRF
jgi:dihydroflavonol-4-reductase